MVIRETYCQLAQAIRFLFSLFKKNELQYGFETIFPKVFNQETNSVIPIRIPHHWFSLLGSLSFKCQTHLRRAYLGTANGALHLLCQKRRGKGTPFTNYGIFFILGVNIKLLMSYLQPLAVSGTIYRRRIWHWSHDIQTRLQLGWEENENLEYGLNCDHDRKIYLVHNWFVLA